jgi:hypothetical protein
MNRNASAATNQGFVVYGGRGAIEEEQNNSVHVQPGDDSTCKFYATNKNARARRAF